MEVRTFHAKELHEALALVKKELGPEALIVSARRVRKGIGLSPVIELTATVEGDSNPAQTPARPQEALPTQELVPLRRELRALRDQLRETAELTEALVAYPPTSASPWMRSLEDADVDPNLASEIVRSAIDSVAQETGANELTMWKAVRNQIAQRLRTIAPDPAFDGTKRTIAVVGPTGVGKTTTLAKLAAHASLVQGLRVVMITLDNYRIAAAEQLSRYADVIGVPMESARDAGELAAARERHADADLILCDTPGRGLSHRGVMDRLRSAFTAISPVQIYLVMTVGTRRHDLRETIQRFAPLGPERLILTKLDETRALGGLLNAVSYSQLPLAYITDGQRIPEDIEAADSDTLARKILGMETQT